MCWHYYNSAVNAENTKATLVTEKEGLVTEKTNLETENEEIVEEKQLCADCSAEIVSIIRLLNAYATTFKQLGAAMEKVKVNRQAYDKGKCYEISEQITSIREEFSEFQRTILKTIREINERILEISTRIGEIDTRLNQIEGLISGLNVTISHKHWNCKACRVLELE